MYTLVYAKILQPAMFTYESTLYFGRFHPLLRVFRCISMYSCLFRCSPINIFSRLGCDQSNMMNGSGSVERQEDLSSFESRRWLKWRPTSAADLAAAEARVLRHVKSEVKGFYVPVFNNNRIWTLKVDPQKPDAIPVVMMHGFGAGSAFWLLNIDAIAKQRAVYAIDMLGFARSSRPKFSTDANVAEEEFANSIEEWREGVGLEKFILLGHSFGGFLAASYSIKHPDRVKHLILADPWGFPERTDQAAEAQRARLPSLYIGIFGVLSFFNLNLLSACRVAGPWGPSLVRRGRRDIQAKFADAFQDDTICDYLYHCNAQSPSAEIAFVNMQIPYGWAKNPMVPRMTQLRQDVPITFIYGTDSFTFRMDKKAGEQTKMLRKDSYVDVMYLQDVGHHVYADKPDKFNKKVVSICEDVDRALQSKIIPTMETSL